MGLRHQRPLLERATHVFWGAALVFLGIGIGRMLPERHRFASAPRLTIDHVEVREDGRVRRVADWRALSAVGQRIGPVDAKVRLIVFDDPSCRTCKQTNAVIDTILRLHPGNVAVVYRYLANSDRSHRAALAGECAAAQWRFYDFLQAERSNHTLDAPDRINDLASATGVRSLNDFRQCVAQGWFNAHVRRDSVLAASLGIRTAPTVIVGGIVIERPSSVEMLDERVRQALLAP